MMNKHSGRKGGNVNLSEDDDLPENPQTALMKREPSVKTGWEDAGPSRDEIAPDVNQWATGVMELLKAGDPRVSARAPGTDTEEEQEYQELVSQRLPKPKNE
jgi:hypothetical protein